MLNIFCIERRKKLKYCDKRCTSFQTNNMCAVQNFKTAFSKAMPKAFHVTLFNDSRELLPSLSRLSLKSVTRKAYGEALVFKCSFKSFLY